MPGESGIWFGFGLSEPTGNPIFDKGRASGITNNSSDHLPGQAETGRKRRDRFRDGVCITRWWSPGSPRARRAISPRARLSPLWSQTYNPGVLISTNYRLQDLKLSFEYLTWPYPVESRHFRLKTLWQVQYVNVVTGFDAPLLPLTTTGGAALIGSNGQPVDYQAAGSRWFISPTLGLGATEYLSKFVRLELNASGFAFPRSWTIWDSDGSLNFRFGHFEVGGGVRAFHFKTSTNATFYIRGTLIAPQVWLRWYSK